MIHPYLWICESQHNTNVVIKQNNPGSKTNASPPPSPQIKRSDPRLSIVEMK